MGLAALLVPVLVVVAVALATSARPSGLAAWTGALDRVRSVERTTRRWLLGGLGTGLVVGTVVLQTGALGRGLLLAAPVAGLFVLAGVLVGELRVTAPPGPVRSAGLEVRRMADYLPRRLFAAVASTAVLLAVVLAVTTAAGSADDIGRPGRALVRRCSATTTEGRGPWPGSFYAVPVLLVVACGLVLAAVVLVRVVRRPRPDAATLADDALRRRSAAAVTAAGGLLVAVPLAGISAVSAMALVGIDCRPGWWSLLAGALGLLVPILLALAGWCLAVLFRPDASHRDPHPVSRRG